MGYPKQRRTWWEVREDDRNINVYNERDFRRALDKTGPRDIVIWNDITVSSTVVLTSTDFTMTSQGGAAILPKESGMTLFSVTEALENMIFDNLRIGKGLGSDATEGWAKFMVLDGGSILRLFVKGCTMWLQNSGEARFIESLSAEYLYRCQIAGNYFRINDTVGGDTKLIVADLGYCTVSNNYVVSGALNLTGAAGNNIITGNIFVSGGIDLNSSGNNIVVANKCSPITGVVTSPPGDADVVANNG